MLALAFIVGEKVFLLLNHRRLKSNCCGYKGEVSLDVDSTLPSSSPLVSPNRIAQPDPSFTSAPASVSHAK